MLSVMQVQVNDFPDSAGVCTIHQFQTGIPQAKLTSLDRYSLERKKLLLKKSVNEDLVTMLTTGKLH